MKLSETIKLLLEEYADRSLAISVLLERTGEKGFGIISIILTLPLLLPVPIPLPGISALFAAGPTLMGFQIAMGWHKPRLPSPIARLELSPNLSRELLKNLTRILRPIERLSRSRLPFVRENWMLYRLGGLCLFWNGLLMSLPLPIPFTNMLPAYTILMLSISVLEADGFLMLVGFGMTIATTLFFSSISGAVLAFFLHLSDRL